MPEEPDLEAVANMDLEADDALRLRVLENLRLLERLGNEPELVRALETALERNFEGDGARRQLAVARAEIAEIKRRLPRMAATNRRLMGRSEELGMHNERLARDNARLRDHNSSRRYQVADVLADAVLKVPGIKRLLGDRRRAQ